MKKNILILLFIPILSFGQFETKSFSGIIQTFDSVVFPYEIHISKFGKSISGYSISDKGGSSETKTKFEISSLNKKLFFKEKEVVYTKADYGSFDDFCLVTFLLEEKEIFKKNQIKIDFKGFFTDNTPCIDGTLNLVSKEFIQKKFKQVENKINKSKIIARKFGDSIQVIKQKVNSVKEKLITSDEIFFSKNDKLRFNLKQNYKVHIRDYSLYDEDVIGLVINEKNQIRIQISEEPTYFELDNKRGNNIIKITGLSEGKYPPITALLIIENSFGEIIHKIKLKLNEKDTNEIVLTRNQ